jgi:hypothetical protein
VRTIFSVSASASTEPPADLAVGVLHGVHHPLRRDRIGAQLLWINHDRILAHHPAEGRDLEDAQHRLQLELQEPGLQTGQLGQIVGSGAIHQGVASVKVPRRDANHSCQHANCSLQLSHV